MLWETYPPFTLKSPCVLMDKISITTLSESSWSPSSHFGSNLTPHSLMLKSSTKLAACDGCVFSPLALRHCGFVLFKAILVDKTSMITVFEGSWSPSSRFGSNPAVHSLHAENFQEACCLCWMRFFSSCSTPLQVPAVRVNAGLLHDGLGDMASLHSSEPFHPCGQDLSHNYF